jgi:hypothetical protein
MATLKEISYDLMQHARSNMTDDDDLDYRSVKFWVKNQRSLWVKNELSKHKETPDKLIQSIDAESVTGSSTLKYTGAINIPLSINGEPQIVRVGGTDDAEIDYKFGTYRHSKHYGNGRFNSDEIFAYYMDNKVYIKGADLSAISTIDIRGVFEDPMDISGMTDDSEYPVPDNFIPYIKAEIIKLDLSIFANTSKDDINDGSNNLN